MTAVGAGGATATVERRADVLLERIDRLFAIGHASGTNRPGLDAGEQEAFDLVAGWMAEEGLAVEIDAGGNLVGRLAGRRPELPEVWTGSHLDTPPDGGRFDGALGVLAGLDAVAAIGRAGGADRRLAVLAFRLEEGARFGRGVFGSRAVAGMLESDEADLCDQEGVTLGEAFAHLGLGELPRAGWLDPPPAAYVETHIEQGPSLAAAGAPLGLVTSIAGMAGYDIAFDGARGHAGTVAMPLRRDALGAAARFVDRLHGHAASIPGAVATVGRMTVLPGATNTIPNRAELFADMRAPDAARLDQLVSGALELARTAAEEARCGVHAQEQWRYEPVPMGGAPVAALRGAIEAAGIEVVGLPSGAGHDATIMGMAGVPCAMLFVRSDAGGVSHAPEEWTERDAIVACVRVLEPALRELASA